MRTSKRISLVALGVLWCFAIKGRNGGYVQAGGSRDCIRKDAASAVQPPAGEVLAALTGSVHHRPPRLFVLSTITSDVRLEAHIRSGDEVCG